MVHALHVERVERQAVAAISAGAELSVSDLLAEFDRDLAAEPDTSEYAELRETLGV